MADREKRKLAVRPPDRSRIALVADTMRHRIVMKGAGRFAGPIQPFPIYRVEALITPQNNRIDPKVSLFNIPCDPLRIIGATAVLRAAAGDPAIHHVVDGVVVPQPFDDVLQFLKLVCALQSCDHIVQLRYFLQKAHGPSPCRATQSLPAPPTGYRPASQREHPDRLRLQTS